MNRTKNGKAALPSQEQILRERYRMLQMHDIISRLSAACFGRDQQVRPFILTEKGKFSESKTRKLVKELFERMEESNEILRGPSFTEDQCSLIKSMLLLSVLIPGTFHEIPYSMEDCPESFSWNLTFEDIFAFLKNTYPPSSEAYYIQNYEFKSTGFGIPDHAFFYMHYYANDLLCFDFHPDHAKTRAKEEPESMPLPETAGDAQNSLVFTHDSEYLTEEDQSFWEFSEADEDYAAWEKEQEKIAMEAQNDPMLNALLEQQAQEMFAAQEAFSAIFPMRKEFEDACRTYRKLVFCCYPMNFIPLTEMAINLFLTRKGISSLVDQQEFWRAHTECAVAVRRVRKNRPWDPEG